MNTTITEESGYIFVKIGGTVTFPELLSILIEVVTKDNYHSTNDVWCFCDCIFSISYNHFSTLTDAIDTRYPKNATRTKTALVVSNGIASGMAEIWVKMAATLPFETKAFWSLAEAEEWIIL